MNIILVFLPLLRTLSFITAADPAIREYNCSDTSFIKNTTYESNLNLLLASLSLASFNTGFYNATAGQGLNKVYGLFLCRGDLTVSTCKDCVTYAAKQLTQYCPVKKQGIIWYDECLLRYSNESIFSSMVERPGFHLLNHINVMDTDKESFRKLVWKLMDQARNEAVNASKLFATGKVNLDPSRTLYGLVQCTPDMSSGYCDLCLREAIQELYLKVVLNVGGRVVYPSCNIRYELYPFYNEALTEALPRAPEQTLATPVIPSPQGEKGREATWIAIGVTVSAIVILMLFCSLLLHKWRRNKRFKEEKTRNKVHFLRWRESRIGSNQELDVLQGEQQLESQEFPVFSLALTLEATKNFSDENKLGQGGFGPVYKGILADGMEIAVKRLSTTSGQGLLEFKNEVTLIAKLQHKNLVRLLGCCLEGNEYLLIYEYMPNKSLDCHLFDSMRSVQLDWKRRMDIINGIARGLLYLHEDSRLKVIHRDLKVSNVLLDSEMNPKISDFGMARIFCGNQNEANTNRIVGTYGYMAPEYAMEGLFSVKSDVFSFGVLLLEILSGKKNNGFCLLSEDGHSLLSYTWKLWCEGHALELMDPVLVNSCVPIELLKCIHIGLLCVQEDPTNRPIMSSVVAMLTSDKLTLPKPTHPAFSFLRIVARPTQSSSEIKVFSVNDATFSNVSPR